MANPNRPDYGPILAHLAALEPGTAAPDSDAIDAISAQATALYEASRPAENHIGSLQGDLTCLELGLLVTALEDHIDKQRMILVLEGKGAIRQRVDPDSTMTMFELGVMSYSVLGRLMELAAQIVPEGEREFDATGQ